MRASVISSFRKPNVVRSTQEPTVVRSTQEPTVVRGRRNATDVCRVEVRVSGQRTPARG